MLDHISLVVTDFDRSVAFYDRCLAPLGIRRVMTLLPGQYPGPNRIAAYGRERPQLWIGEHGMSFWGEGHGVAKSPIHLALSADSRELVAEFHKAALEAGGKDYGAPGVRAHYHPSYYGAFVLDPDGNNIEAVCHKPG